MTIVRMLKQTFHPQAGGPVDVGQEVTIPNELAEHWDLSDIAEIVDKLGEDSGRLRRPVAPAQPTSRPPVRSVRPQAPLAPRPEPEPLSESHTDEPPAKPPAPAVVFACKHCDRTFRTKFARDSHEKSHKDEPPAKD